MYKLLLSFFLSGFVLGSTVCLLSCGVVLFPFATRGNTRWQAGVKTGIFFGLGRVLVYVVLGALAAVSHHVLAGFLESPFPLLAGGLVLAGLGLWFFFREEQCGGCGVRRLIPPFLAGIFYGLVPCLPLTGFLLYLVYVSRGVAFGALAGLVFGLGTLASPLLILCGLYPLLGAGIEKKTGAKKLVRAIGAAILFAWGLGLMIRGLFPMS